MCGGGEVDSRKTPALLNPGLWMLGGGSGEEAELPPSPPHTHFQCINPFRRPLGISPTPTPTLAGQSYDPGEAGFALC